MQLYRFGILILFYVACLFANQKQTEPNWLSFKQAVLESKQQDKYLFVYFWADWCSYCEQMKETTFKDSSILNQLNSKFKSIKLDVEDKKRFVFWNGDSISYKGFSNELDVQSLPTVLFMKSTEEGADILGRVSSFIDASTLQNLLNYISSGAREEGLSFDEYSQG